MRTIGRAWPLLFLGLFPLASAVGETSFWLRNDDALQLFVWWAAPETTEKGVALGALATAPGGAHLVAPGERVWVTLPEQKALLGAFVPWTAPLRLTTPLQGGWILTVEAPSKGTVLVNASAWASANRGRLFQATLQEWGQEVPVLVLDGKLDDWKALPSGTGWSATWGRNAAVAPPALLQVVDREGALWLRLGLQALPPAGTELSLLLTWADTTWEWPVTGEPAEVWAWTEGATPSAVGRRVRNGLVLEAFLPWDRVPASARRAWGQSQGTWKWVSVGPSGRSSQDLAPFHAEDLR